MNMDLYWMGLAYEAAEKESNCAKRQVGACIVSRKGRRIAEGANVTKGVCDQCNRKLCSAIHAEITAIKRLPNKDHSIEKYIQLGVSGSTIYITYQPCLNCAKAIKDAGITRVVFDKESGDFSGTNFLKYAGIEVLYLEKYVSNLPKWKTLEELMG